MHDFSVLLCFVKIMELSFDITCSLVDDSYWTSQSESPLEVAAGTITKVSNEYSCFFKKKSICYLDDDTIRGLWWYLFCSILFWCTMDAMHGIEKTKLGDNINIKWPTICITRALSISCFEHGWCPKIFITICLWS